MKDIIEILAELEKERIKEMKMRDIFQHCISWIETLKEYRVESVAPEEADALQERIDKVLDQLRSVAEHDAGYLNRTYSELMGRMRKDAKDIEMIQDHLAEVARLMKDLKKDVDRMKQTMSKEIIADIHSLITRLNAIMGGIITKTGMLEQGIKAHGKA